MFQAIVQDARYAARILRKNPVFAAVAIAVVALGTGAVSTIFSVANAIVLRPIPGVARPAEVFQIERTRAAGGDSRSLSYPYYQHVAAGAKTMTGVAAFDMVSLTISTGSEGMFGQGNLVTGNYFDVLGVKPALGRFFAPDEDRVADAHPVVVISHDLWQRRFAGDSAIVGKPVLVNGRQFTVIGVAPAKFSGLYPVVRIDAWVPMMMQGAVRRGEHLLTSPNAGWLDVFGRIKPGVSPEAASAELTGLTKQYVDAVERGASNDWLEFDAVTLSRISGFPGDRVKPVLAFFVVLLAVSGLVLLIASVNVASMLLARAVARRREIAVRIALGAGRARLVRQLLTESVILFGFGGAFGVVLAIYATRLLGRIPLPADVPIAVDPTPDVRVLFVTLTVAGLTGLAFGLAPALQGTRADLATVLRGDTSGGGRARTRLRNVLVAAQVAASLLLLTTSGLFIRALARGEHVDPGYDIAHVATASLDVGLSGYDSTRARAFYGALRDRLRAMPGVQTVAYTRVLPLAMNTMGYSIAVSGYVTTGKRQGLYSNANVVDEGYFDALRLPIVEGRGLLASDDANAPSVAVVSQRFAERFWPGQSAIGHVFKLDSTTTVTVVGVTRDVKFARLDEKPATFMYLPAAQHYRSDANLLVRTTGDAAALAPAIRDAVHALDEHLPPPAVVTLETAASGSLLPQRFAVIVTATLGAIGLVLATIGLYGVLSFSTAQRTREIGVRMALGAARRDVLALVVREGMRVVAAGVGAGLVLAVIATRSLAPFLFGVNPLDAGTYVAMTAILGGAALLASFLPARRAAAGDPMLALRQD